MRTSFVGREAELAEATSAFEHTRLLTIAGTGGVGKTRLALRLAADIADGFPDGVCFVDLAALTDPRFVSAAALAVLGIRQEAARDTDDTLINDLRVKRALIVFDNCEHVRDEVARLARRLLAECPDVRLLATSRRALDIEGELVRRLPSFSEVDGVALFVTRAEAVLPSFTLGADNADIVKQICRRLDGIPLAIELAAARVKIMTLSELQRRLDDRFRILTGGSDEALGRHRTLRALIEWSYNLLDDSEQALLRRLAVFAGAFTQEAACAVCGLHPLEEATVAAVLEELVNKSLVQPELLSESPGYRLGYRVLESTKQFGLERLDEAIEVSTLRLLHAQYFRAGIEASRGAGAAKAEAFHAEIARDYPDYRAALQWALADAGNVALGAALAAAMGRYWTARGQWREGRYWLEQVLQHEAQVPLATLAHALDALSSQYFVQGEYALMGTLSRRAGEAYAQLGDARGQAGTRSNLAIEAYFAGRYDEAYALYQSNLAAFREFGDRRMEAITLGNLAELLTEWKGDYAQSERLYELAAAIHRERGDSRVFGLMLADWSQTAAYEGALDRAERLAQEALDIFRRIGDEMRSVEALIRMAQYRVWGGSYKAAADALQEAVDGLRASMHALYLARFIEACADLALATGQAAEAATLFGFADEWREERNLQRPLPMQTRANDAAAAVRDALGEEDFASAWERGRRLEPQDALEAAAGAARAAP
jgi:predicted ATPase